MMNQSPEVFYLDAQVSNLNSTTTNQLAYYNASRTLPYLYKPEDYYGAITQFSIQLTDIPLLNAVIVPNQGDINLTIYKIGLGYKNSFVELPIIYSPQNSLSQVPLPPSSYPDGLQNLSTGYYNIYSYNYFCLLVNQTIQQLFLALYTLEPTLPTTYPLPIFKYDSQTALFYLVAPEGLYNDKYTNFVSIYLNSALNHLLLFFPNNLYTINNQSYHLIFINDTTGTIDTNNNLIVFQELNSTNLWSQVVSIVITSQFLPVSRSQSFTPLLYYNNTPLISQYNSTSQNILIEYSITDSIYTKTFTYNPTAQYRMFSMSGDNPLYNLDFKFWYRTSLGNLEPIYLNAGGFLSLKIGFFEKKSFSKLKI
jgi:hypothetical protein